MTNESIITDNSTDIITAEIIEHSPTQKPPTGPIAFIAVEEKASRPFESPLKTSPLVNTRVYDLQISPEISPSNTIPTTVGLWFSLLGVMSLIIIWRLRSDS